MLTINLFTALAPFLGRRASDLKSGAASYAFAGTPAASAAGFTWKCQRQIS